MVYSKFEKNIKEFTSLCGTILLIALLNPAPYLFNVSTTPP